MTANPLKSAEDIRLQKIAGPSGLIMFGVTGDLSRKKLLPAIYDLANRGLLPPAFSLVGFARRDWSEEDFEKVVYEAVKQYSRTSWSESVWEQLVKGIRFVSGRHDDPAAFAKLKEVVDELDAQRGTAGNHTFYLSIPTRDFPLVLDQLAKTGNQVGEMSFAQKLSQLVPDFADVDKDERWVSWLNEHDAMLNGPRRMLAQQAFDKGDAEAVARYVKLWKQTIAEPEADPRAGRQAELEKQVAPNRSANSVDTKKVGKEAKVYSENEITTAWNRIRTMNTKGQFDEAAKLEAEITAAYLEGRVRL